MAMSGAQHLCVETSEVSETSEVCRDAKSDVIARMNLV
jgi:hypothetical protein